MTEPTADDLARWAEEHQPYPSRSLVGVAICRHCGDTALWPCEPTQLLALVAAQADQIAELRAALDVAETQANNHAEDAILLERAVKRVRALCREAEIATAASRGDAPYRARVLVADVLVALDGTEATP